MVQGSFDVARGAFAKHAAKTLSVGGGELHVTPIDEAIANLAPRRMGDLWRFEATTDAGGTTRAWVDPGGRVFTFDQGLETILLAAGAWKDGADAAELTSIILWTRGPRYLVDRTMAPRLTMKDGSGSLVFACSHRGPRLSPVTHEQVEISLSADHTATASVQPRTAP